jgi:subtilisin family serine protease
MSRSRRRAPAKGSQLIVVVPPGTDPRQAGEIVRSHRGAMHLLFSHQRERLEFEAKRSAGAGVREPDLTRFYRARVPEHAHHDVRERLRRRAGVTAHITPPAELPIDLTDLRPRRAVPTFPTPDFIAMQGYLDPAPVGVDARFAWTRAGGGGEGVTVIDIEAAWRFSHEDLRHDHGGAQGHQSPQRHLRNHGTAVAGIVVADRGPSGVTGISPEASFRGIFALNADNPDGPEVAAAVRSASQSLHRGDIILIELQHPGPPDFEPRKDRRGYIPVEWWPENFAAIKAATARGILVIETAGNGDVDLDDPVYDAGDAFPDDWKNPLRRGAHDSGAILVGAGAPPEHFVPEELRAETGPARSRLPFSNYGRAIDVQGWGRGVTTCGYGTLQGGPSENYWYVDRFGGTSSAGAIVAGVLACVQGIRRRRRLPPLTPAEARQLLRRTGSRQVAHGAATARNRRIGSLPDLRELIDAMPG